MPRPYQKRRSKWAAAVMAKHFPDWKEYDEQVPLFDLRGYDLRTVESAGVLTFARLMPRADLIAVRSSDLLVIEFDNQMVLTNIVRLDRYVEAIKNDHVRPTWRTLAIKPVLVTPGYDGRFEAECRRRGYRYIVEAVPR